MTGLFFERLGARLQNPLPSLRVTDKLDAFVLFLLVAKQGPRLTRNTAAALFIDETKLYPSTGKDPVGSLWRRVQRLRADRTKKLEILSS